MLLFYFRLGRAPLPRWYAHNPLWKPVYLVIFLLLIIFTISGALMPDNDVIMGWYLPSLHRSLAVLMFWLNFLHPLSVILHDYRGNTTDTSAIINGFRHFLVEKKSVGDMEFKKPSVRLDEIGK